MNVIADFKDRDIGKILGPTIDAFLPLLEQSRTSIENIRRDTFRYGSTERHQLDVYYPPTTVSAIKPAFLLFVYGGGFWSGDRVFQPPKDLGYKNLGAFFANRGFVTVIPDYRLVPQAQFPDPSEDIRDALSYIVQNVTEADPNRIYILAHSAGAVHVTTFLFKDEILQNTDIRERIKGVTLSGCPVEFNSSPGDKILQYYGSKESLLINSPMGLLKSVSGETIRNLPPILIYSAENEPVDEILSPQEEFILMLEKKAERKVELLIGKGHNHISSIWALFSGEGEEWGSKVADWFIEQN